MTESRPVRLALIQFESELGNPAKNTERACQMIAEAAEAGADLVLLPELFSTGYQLNAIGPILGDLVEPVDGPRCARCRRRPGPAGATLPPAWPSPAS